MKEPKDHEIALFVNELRNIAMKYVDTQQLRARIATCVKNFIDDLKENEGNRIE